MAARMLGIDDHKDNIKIAVSGKCFAPLPIEVGYPLLRSSAWVRPCSDVKPKTIHSVAPGGSYNNAVSCWGAALGERMRHRLSRRKLFRTSTAGLAGLAASSPGTPDARAAVVAAPAVVGLFDISIKKVERTWVEVPFRPVPDRNMKRELYHWRYFEICQVTLGCGVVGFGEAMVYYGGRPLSDEIIGRVTGKKAAEVMWDDSLGNGLQ